MMFRIRGAIWLRALAFLSLIAAPLAAQQQAPALSLDSAVHIALRTHPRVEAARAAVIAAESRTRQASVRANPTLSWRYERTARSGAENAQHITTLEQPLAFGQRGARHDAAAAEEEAASADLLAVQLDITVLTTVLYAAVLETARRHDIATRSAAAFAEAARIVDARLAAGDASGYEQRRVQLEAARYAAVREARGVEARRARRALLALVEPASANRDRALDLSFEITPPPGYSDDSLLARGRAQRPDLRAAAARLRAQEAQARLASWQRLPVPTLAGGLKTETAAGLGTLRGVAAGVSIPLPLFDRRSGARDAAVADATQAQRQLADRQQLAALEILSAADAVRSLELQISALLPALGESAERAIATVNIAFAEGDISLDAWLLAVRAYDEAEEALATLRADALVRRAELARAIGQPSIK